MNELFFGKQHLSNQDLYRQLLASVGSLSNLFAETTVPFIYYRAMENVFCKAFDAHNLGRSDISVDAKKGTVGIGLKTFLHNNGRTYQKIAEFNKESHNFTDLKPVELAYLVAKMRNERLSFSKRACKASDMIYHLLTRSEGYLAVYEEEMEFIDLSSIRLIKNTKTTLHFTDGLHDYSFNISKSTLFKRFLTESNKRIAGFDVEVLEDPYEFLLSSMYQKEKDLSPHDHKNEISDYIVLPLYSPSKDMVNEKSGLNQWNASGRLRDFDEVYISVPKVIHRLKPHFFTYNTEDHKTAPFEVRLPNEEVLSMKIAQDGGKALMSNPNSALGKWILRDVLGLKPGELLNKQMLDEIGIDSVQLSKTVDGTYVLDFLKTGSYDEFILKFSD